MKAAVIVTPPTSIFVLSLHAPYVCGRSGVCCASGWDIPVDPRTRTAIASAIGGGALALPQPANGDTRWCEPASALPAPDVAVLTRRADGDCLFLRRATPVACAIQDACGHAALPHACQQFPRVTMADDRGLHVSLSHYCPAAADLLLADDSRSLEVWQDPPGWAADSVIAGLDARGHWPPLLRPGVLMSLDAWSRWERFCVATWARPATLPAGGLAAIARAASAVRAWTPEAGALDTWMDATLASALVASPADAALDPATAWVDWEAAWDAVPDARAARPAIPAIDAVRSARFLLDGQRLAVTRFLAAKCVASWAAYQGHGLLAFTASVRMAAHVLLVEAARGAESNPRSRLREAIRRADLLLVHVAEAGALAAAWNRAEASPAASAAPNA